MFRFVTRDGSRSHDDALKCHLLSPPFSDRVRTVVVPFESDLVALV